MVWGEWARLMKGQIDEGESPAREVRGDVQQWQSTCVREQGVVGQNSSTWYNGRVTELSSDVVFCTTVC